MQVPRLHFLRPLLTQKRQRRILTVSENAGSWGGDFTVRVNQQVPCTNSSKHLVKNLLFYKTEENREQEDVKKDTLLQKAHKS